MDELWGLASHPSQHQFMTSGSDKQVHLWDSMSRSVVWSKELSVSNGSITSAINVHHFKCLDTIARKLERERRFIGLESVKTLEKNVLSTVRLLHPNS